MAESPSRSINAPASHMRAALVGSIMRSRSRLRRSPGAPHRDLAQRAAALR